MAQWWNKDSRRGTSVVVKMENPNFSMVELESPEAESDTNDMTERSAPIKGTGRKNAKQMTWVLLLKAHKAAGCLASLAAGAVSVGAALRRRLTFRAVRGALNVSGRLTKVIRGFLIFSLVLLGFELLAYFRGWDFARPSLDFVPAFGVSDLVEWIYSSWIAFRVAYLAPPLQTLSDFCVVLFLIQSVDRMVLCLGCFWIKWNRIKPIPKSELAGVDGSASDLERGAEEEYPKVLIQMPMCNEREVYQQSIAAICGIDWPKDRMLVQVLDDSDDAELRMLIEAEVQRWQQKGIHIVYRHRVVRTGYKAGNLKSAMNCDYVKDYEFVAIFDADFQPKSDFLKKTVPHFKGNDDLALVQARWSFINKDENLLTRLQNINLCFHFEVEQQVNAAYIHFFGFNGTAGVWRIKALEESGGWLERTTVEDMDIAVRAHLHGWKFVFLNDVTCLCELPESYEAYRKQQHRWHSGPMQLFRLSLPDVIRSEIGVGKKANLIFLFFLLRKLILPFYSFTLFCIILPMTMFIPEAQLPSWVVCYIPAIMSIMNILPSPKSFPFIVPYLLFENTMSVTKFNAMVSGLFQLGSAYEWIVTKKSGRSSEADLLSLVEKESHPMDRKKHHRGASDSDLDALSKLNDQKSQPPAKKKKNRIYKKELSLALLLLTAAARSLMSAQGIHFYFLLFQGITFLVVGLDLIGEQVS